MPTPVWKPLDDAGKPLPNIPDEVLWEHLLPPQPPEGERPGWCGVVFVLAAAGLAAWLIPLLVRNISWTVSAVYHIAATIGALVLLSVIVEWVRRKTTKRRPPVPAETALIAAHRHCGACGYRLHGVEPDLNGLCTCPECGAAWHRDRWTRADVPLDRDRLDDILHQPTYSYTDDRGMPLPETPGWPPRWFDEQTTLPALSSTLAAGRRRRLIRVAIAIPILVACWVAITAPLGQRVPGHPSRILSIGDVFVMGLIPVIGLCILYLVWRIHLPWPGQKAIVLASSCCPHCGHHPLSATPPAFDGCTPCPACGCAWRLRSEAPSQREGVGGRVADSNPL